MTHLRLVRPDHVREQFRENFSSELRLEIVRRILNCYANADEHCAMDDEGTRRDHLPHERRRLIETAMRTIPQDPRFGSLKVVSRPNSRKSAHHNVLICGGFALTFSKTDGETDLPRFSFFRHDYASSVQLNLFETDEQVTASQAQSGIEDRFFGVVCHGPDDSDSASTGFIRVQFPSASVQSPVLAPSIDLLAEYMQSFSIKRPDTIEIAAAEPRLKVVRPAEESSS